MKKANETTKSTTKCQCPQRASTYFYEVMKAVKIYLEKGVNALNGLLLISTRKRG